MQLIGRMLFFFCVLIGGFAALEFAWGAFGQEGPANNLLGQKYELNEVYAAENVTGGALEKSESASGIEAPAEPEVQNPFGEFYYYEKDKQYRYEDYQLEKSRSSCRGSGMEGKCRAGSEILYHGGSSRGG